MQSLLAFSPRPGLDLFGKLDASRFARDGAETRGQELLTGRAMCSICYPAPYHTDNLMHDLKVERYFEPRTSNGLNATAQGPIKTFSLRGIKDLPSYFHEARLPTLEATLEFFNLVFELDLKADEKANLVGFLRQL